MMVPRISGHLSKVVDLRDFSYKSPAPLKLKYWSMRKKSSCPKIQFNISPPMYYYVNELKWFSVLVCTLIVVTIYQKIQLDRSLTPFQIRSNIDHSIIVSLWIKWKSSEIKLLGIMYIFKKKKHHFKTCLQGRGYPPPPPLCIISQFIVMTLT